MKKLIFILLFLLPVLCLAQVRIGLKASNETRSYTVTNADDGTSIKTSGSTMYVANPFYNVSTFTASDATPTISNYSNFKTANTVATTITDFDNEPGTNSKFFLLYINDDYTTIQDGANIDCGSDDLECFTGDVVQVLWNGSNWEASFLNPQSFIRDSYVQVGVHSSWANALSAADSDTLRLEVYDNVSVSSNDTISNITSLYVAPGGIINLTDTLVIEGDFSAGVYQAFNCTGNGAVIFDSASVSEVLTEWFGAKVNDGVADNAAIEDALVALSNAALPLKFMVGTYELDSTIVLPDSVTLIGSGREATKLNFTKDGGASATGEPVIEVNASNGVTIKDLAIDGNAENNSYYGEYDHGIYLADANRINLENLYIHDVSGDGVYIADCDYVTVNNCIIDVPNVNAAGPQVGRNCIGAVEGTFIKVINSTLLSGKPAAIDIEPNANLVLKHVLISNCQIYDSGSDNVGSINIQGDASGCTLNDVKVANCQVSGSASIGIRVDTATDWDLSNNTIYNCTAQAIYILDGTSRGKIQGNTCYGNTSTGISILHNCSKIDIINNTSHTNGTSGIYIAGTSGNESSLLSIKGNTCYNNESDNSGTYSGIKCSYMDDSYVQGNFCYDDSTTHTQLYGFDMQYCDDIVFAADNYGHDNKTRLYNFSNCTVVRSGSLVNLVWSKDAVDDNKTNQPMFVSGSATDGITMPFAGQVIGMGVYSNQAITTGTLTVNLTKNGVACGYSLAMTGSVKQNDRQDLNDSDSDLLFSEGDYLAMIYTSTSGMVPDSTADISVVVTIKM